jgi:hypothetical protein
MAKKYLLYIHNDTKFDEVQNKSQLVNDLLAMHWGVVEKGGYHKIQDSSENNWLECKKGHPYKGERCLICGGS